MHATLLVFLAAAWLNALALEWLLAEPASRGAVLAAGAATGGVLLLAIATAFAGLPAPWPIDPTSLSRYLAMVAFFAVLLRWCRPLPFVPAAPGPLRAWLRLLPLLVANTAVLACLALAPTGMPDAVIALATSFGLTLVMLLLLPVGVAFLHRLRLGAAPRLVRGAPLLLLSAAAAALGTSGWAPLLPW